MKSKEHGGIGLYSKQSECSEIEETKILNLEHILFKIPERNLIVAVIYRPPSFSLKLFRPILKRLIEKLKNYPGTKLIMGDFNVDASKRSTVKRLLIANGFKQIVTKATTVKGTTIDHIYMFPECKNIEIDIIPTFYSDHEAINIKLL